MSTAPTAPTPELVCIRIDYHRAGKRWWALDDKMVFAAERALGWFPGTGLVWRNGRCARVPAWIVDGLREALGDDAHLLVVTKWK